MCINSIVHTLQSAEEWIDPALAFARKYIEKITGLPLTAKEAPKAQQMAAPAATNAPDSGTQARAQASTAGGGPGTGAPYMATNPPNTPEGDRMRLPQSAPFDKATLLGT